MRKIILGLTAARVVGGTALAAAPANANTSPNDWQIGGTTTLNVGDVTYGANGQCVNAPVTVKINVPDDYAYLDFEYTSSYDGPTTWAAQARAADIMPSFAGAPSGWTVDRFAPLSFSDVGTYTIGPKF